MVWSATGRSRHRLETHAQVSEDERRRSGRPLVGVGAVLLSDTLDRVLLIQRGTEPALGKWSVPGGLVERGEPLREACRREVREETGLDVQLEAQPIKLLERAIRDEAGHVAYHYLIIDFWARVPASTPQAGSDVRQVKWVAVDQVQQLDGTASLVEVIWRALRVARGQSPETPLLE